MRWDGNLTRQGPGEGLCGLWRERDEGKQINAVPPFEQPAAAGVSPARGVAGSNGLQQEELPVRLKASITL